MQLDFQLPARFELSYSAEDEGKIEVPVMLHRAILGSVERMFAILLEHYKGKWPFWLSPRQAIVCPVSEKSQSYALKVIYLKVLSLLIAEYSNACDFATWYCPLLLSYSRHLVLASVCMLLLEHLIFSHKYRRGKIIWHHDEINVNSNNIKFIVSVAI